jgi:hypothetical protein
MAKAKAPLDRLLDGLAKLDGVSCAPSQFSDRPAYWVNGKEIAHVEGANERGDSHSLDLRLTRAQISARRARLKADPRVTLRRSGGDWLELRVASAEDVAFGLELCALAVEAHK